MSKKFKSTVINIRQLAKLAGVSYFVIYRRRQGVVDSILHMDTKTQIANALAKDISPFMKDLGFEVKISPLRG